MLYFNTRKQARTFAHKQPHYKVVDNGVDSFKRWAIKFTK